MTVINLGEDLTLAQVVAVARNGATVGLGDAARTKVVESRATIDRMVNAGQAVYGVTTGFGKFSDIMISPEETGLLSHKVVMSSACGVGEPLPEDATRALMLLRAQSLAYGHSGIQLETLQLLIEMINRRVHPVVPAQGSVGASGDLAPLAHMALPLIGLGEAVYNGEQFPGAEALRRAGLEPVMLGSKEGLALINGTQAMTAIGALALHDALALAKVADIAGVMTAEALQGIPAAWDERLQAVRRHTGQMAAGANLRRLADGSGLLTAPGAVRMQDAYALRCMPQVHGASRAALGHVAEMIAGELNAVTDNPIIFADTGEAISGGNFHGQPMALPMDYLGIASAELANISERRTERLVNPQLSELPAFLVENGGLNTGFMVAQYTAAALVSENKVLAHPASVDSIPTSANQEDHVSMGTIAARKARSILTNATRVLAVELMCAAQALEFTDPGKLAPGTRAAYEAVREHVPVVHEDDVLAPYIEAVGGLIASGELLGRVEAAVGPLN